MPVHAAGFGVERVMQVLLGRNDIGMVDVIAMCRDKIGGMATHRLADAKTQRAATVAADHLRGLAFLANEGAPDLPGKENKGRRWIINRYAKSLRAACVDLGIEADALVLAVLPDITACYSQWYPLLRENEPLIGIRLIKLLQRNGGV
jgi:alanyl-tRNA synthetase